MSARRAAAAALVGLLAVLGCRPAPAPAPAPVPAARPGSSLYQLHSEWTDQTGARVPLALFEGHPTVVVMFYGTCESACPTLVHEVQEIEAGLPQEPREALRVLLVTFDPERDTTEKLAAYAASHDLAAARWRLLRGDPEDVRLLAAALGVRYRALGDGTFSHSMQISLLDAEGRLVFHSEGLEPAHGTLAARVLALAQQEEKK